MSKISSLCKKYDLKSFVDDVSINLLESLYSSTDRYYHNADHIVWCFNLVDKVAKNNVDVMLALLFHDAIYNTRDSSNEENSAKLFLAVADKFEPYRDYSYADRVANMIRLTKHEYKAKRLSKNSKLVLDIDLSAIASESFAADEENIRKEYSWVPDDIFWSKRLEFLKFLLGQEHIYHSDFGRESFEKLARENILVAIERIHEKNKKE